MTTPDQRAPCPTCSGSTRRTAGMVCETCGTGYAPDIEVAPLPPLTSLTAAAASLHELYLAYVEVGFTADQAFEIVLTVLRGNLEHR